MKIKKSQISRYLVIILIFTVSLGIMIYPFVSNYLAEHKADDMIENYDAIAASEDYSEEIERARKFNEALANGNVTLQDPFAENISGVNEETYESLLRMNGTDAMGYIRIPEIDVELPIYHGTSADVLEQGVGHLKGSSMPIGGEGTHTVLTGHTGLSNAKLFTDLTLLKEGDYFFITVYDLKLCYQVDQIKVVIPEDVSDLGIVDGEDYCTLVTCTPYGINSHRLLVRGVRCEYTEELEDSVATVTVQDSEWLRQYKKAVIFSIILMFVIIFVVTKLQSILRRRKKQ